MMQKIDITKCNKKMLLKFVREMEDLRVKFIEADYFEDFYPHIFEIFEFTEEQLAEVKNDFIKRRIK
jgi:hypothetical protein